MMTFIYCPKPYLVNPSAQVGLGLLSLATYARELGAGVEVLDAQSEPDSWEPAEFGPICLLSGCLVDSPVISRLAGKLRQEGSWVAVGGPIATSPAPAIQADWLVCGPGEPSIAEMVGGARPQGMRFQTGKLDFDSYPFPDRSLLPNSGGRIFHSKTGVEEETSTTLSTSRGCAWQCAFCSSGSESVSCHYYSLDRIEQEVQSIRDLGIRNIRVNDDNIVASVPRCVSICDILKRYGMRWRASLRTSPNSESIYRHMVECGCVELSFGVESGDDDVLRLMNKRCSVEQNSEAIRNAIKAGVPNVRALMMAATPGESRETLERNKRWVEAMPAELTVCVTCFVPFPGTAIHASPQRFGCRIESMTDQNIYMYRGDGSTAQACISNVGGMGRDELTQQLHAFVRWLEDRGQINRG